jgi:ribonuclease HII
MSGVVTWDVVSTVVGALVLAASVMGWVVSRFAARDKKIEELRESLNKHKLHAAETYATKAGLTESLERVHTSVDRLTSRIDEFMRKASGG